MSATEEPQFCSNKFDICLASYPRKVITASHLLYITPSTQDGFNLPSKSYPLLLPFTTVSIFISLPSSLTHPLHQSLHLSQSPIVHHSPHPIKIFIHHSLCPSQSPSRPTYISLFIRIHPSLTGSIVNPSITVTICPSRSPLPHHSLLPGPTITVPITITIHHSLHVSIVLSITSLSQSPSTHRRFCLFTMVLTPITSPSYPSHSFSIHHSLSIHQSLLTSICLSMAVSIHQSDVRPHISMYIHHSVYQLLPLCQISQAPPFLCLLHHSPYSANRDSKAQRAELANLEVTRMGDDRVQNFRLLLFHHKERKHLG